MTIANGFVSYSPDTTSPFNYATTATYTCNDGFFLSVDAARVCIGDGSSVTGSFSGSDPVCTRKYTYTVHAVTASAWELKLQIYRIAGKFGE